MPSRPSTSAIGRTHSGANTPTSWRGALAGLDNGPSRLKIVLVPSSTRVGATWRVALWWRGAIRKPMPISHKQARTIAKSTSMLTPSAVNTSAEPDCEESARLPCLATGTPQPAATKALAVEMLKLPEESPPVPQVSIVPGGASTAIAFARMIRAAPAISSTVSPRTLSAIRNAPICDGVAFPLMMISKAASAWPSLKPRPWATWARNGFKSSVSPVIGRTRSDGRSAACVLISAPVQGRKRRVFSLLIREAEGENSNSAPNSVGFIADNNAISIT